MSIWTAPTMHERIIELEKEVERLTALEADYNNTKKACAKLYAEIERLQNENNILRADDREARAEIERLKAERDELFLENGKLANELGAECLQLRAALWGLCECSYVPIEGTRSIEVTVPIEKWRVACAALEGKA